MSMSLGGEKECVWKLLLVCWFFYCIYDIGVLYLFPRKRLGINMLLFQKMSCCRLCNYSCNLLRKYFLCEGSFSKILQKSPEIKRSLKPLCPDLLAAKSQSLSLIDK